MIRSTFLIFFIICGNNCFSQNTALDHVHGFVYFPPQIFSQNNIKKEIIYSIDTTNGITDSTIDKTIFYDYLGNKIEEIKPRYQEDTLNTVFYYNSKREWITEITNKDTTGEAKNEYDIYGNMIKRYYKSGNQIIATFIDSFNNKQQLIKAITINSLKSIDTISTYLYYYDDNGKIDSIIKSTKQEKYTLFCKYNNADDTTLLYKKDKSEVTMCIYNEKKQLIKKISTNAGDITDIYNKRRNLLAIQTDIFSYNINGTLCKEETENKTTLDAKLMDDDRTIHHYYYFQ